ncbi:MAG TPA: cytochrome c [Polyangia bacterium]|nr:cytochrome c [Polyangia bacterium]
MLQSAPRRAGIQPASTGLLLSFCLLLAVACSGGTPTSCPTEYPTSCPSPAPTFSADVGPLIQAHCAVCHGPGQQIPRLDTDEVISMPSTRQKVFFQIQHCSMPPAPRPPLSAAERDTILAWLVCSSAAHD